MTKSAANRGGNFPGWRRLAAGWRHWRHFHRAPSLSQAARRAHTGLLLAETWDSSFLRAMSIVANSGTNMAGYPSATVFLGAEHWSWKYLAPSELAELFTFVFEIVDDKLRAQRVDADSSADEESIVDAALNFSPLSFSTTTVNPIDARNVLASLLYLPPREEVLLGTLVSWLLRLHSPTEVVAAAQRHIETIQRAEWLHLLGHLQYSMVPRLVTTLADRCLAFREFTAHAHLAHLCTTCLLHTPSIRSRAPAGFVFFARPLLMSLLETLSHLDASQLSQTPQGAQILRDVPEIRRSVEEDLLWKAGRDEVLRDFDQFFARGTLETSSRPLSDAQLLQCHLLVTILPQVIRSNKPRTELPSVSIVTCWIRQQKFPHDRRPPMGRNMPPPKLGGGLVEPLDGTAEFFT